MAEIQVEKLSKRYGEVTSVDKVSLSVKKGEIFALIGPSGTGKSTLLKIIDLLEPPTSGEVYLDGLAICPLKGVERLAAIKRMGIVFQRPVVFNRSVLDNIRYSLEIRDISEAKIKTEVQPYLDMLGLSNLSHRNALLLSGGEAQRVALARTLVYHPEVLLLDEPTANLDPANVAIIEDAIVEANKKERTTVLIATHNMFQAKRIAHKIGFMLSGRIIETGVPSRIFEKPKDSRTKSFVEGKMVF